MPFRFGKARPAFEPDPPQPEFRVTWTPQPLPQGEVMPTDTLAALADAARRRNDPWAGTRDTDRRA